MMMVIVMAAMAAMAAICLKALGGSDGRALLRSLPCRTPLAFPPYFYSLIQGIAIRKRKNLSGRERTAGPPKTPIRKRVYTVFIHCPAVAIILSAECQRTDCTHINPSSQGKLQRKENPAIAEITVLESQPKDKGPGPGPGPWPGPGPGPGPANVAQTFCQQRAIPRALNWHTHIGIISPLLANQKVQCYEIHLCTQGTH